MSTKRPLLLDVSRLIWRRWTGRLATGVDRVCLAYVNHFAAHAQAVIQHDKVRKILDLQASQRLFRLIASDERSFRYGLAKAAVANFWSPASKGDGRPYLNVGHTGLNSPGFRRWLDRTDVKPIYFVHDLIPIARPEFCRLGEAEKHRERMRTVIETGVGVIGNSQATVDELSTFASAQNLATPPAIAAWLGTDGLARQAQTSIACRPTFVILGTIEARKNHIMLLEIWSRLVERMGCASPRLLIIGQRGWEAEPVFRILDHNQALRGHVIEISRCSDEELAEHLASARALLFPSFAEGYGLPLIEGLGLGLPVIASDLPVFREICGEIPTYLSPTDQPGWEQAILDYSKPDSPARFNQLKRVDAFIAPTWKRHFALVENWLDRLV